MSPMMKKAILSTLEMWKTLDDYHKGREYEKAKEHLESWLKDTETLDN